VSVGSWLLQYTSSTDFYVFRFTHALKINSVLFSLAYPSTDKKRCRCLLSSTYFDHSSLFTTLHISLRFADTCCFGKTACHYKWRATLGVINILDSRNLLTTNDTQPAIDPKARHWSFAPVMGPRQNIATMCGMEKLEWTDMQRSTKKLCKCM